LETIYALTNLHISLKIRFSKYHQIFKYLIMIIKTLTYEKTIRTTELSACTSKATMILNNLLGPSGLNNGLYNSIFPLAFTDDFIADVLFSNSNNFNPKTIFNT
jgi:hypothetical protein